MTNTYIPRPRNVKPRPVKVGEITTALLYQIRNLEAAAAKGHSAIEYLLTAGRVGRIRLGGGRGRKGWHYEEMTPTQIIDYSIDFLEDLRSQLGDDDA